MWLYWKNRRQNIYNPDVTWFYGTLFNEFDSFNIAYVFLQVLRCKCRTCVVLNRMQILLHWKFIQNMLHGMTGQCYDSHVEPIANVNFYKHLFYFILMWNELNIRNAFKKSTVLENVQLIILCLCINMHMIFKRNVYYATKISLIPKAAKANCI